MHYNKTNTFWNTADLQLAPQIIHVPLKIVGILSKSWGIPHKPEAETEQTYGQGGS